MLGANARRMYGIPGKLFVTDEPAEMPRRDWYPDPAELEQWAAAESDPRGHGVTQSIDFSKLDPRMLLAAIRSY
jgi:hypothetical protein